ncbi:hypothetical protein JCM3765_004420 [Sporobolomyces pararoseus]
MALSTSTTSSRTTTRTRTRGSIHLLCCSLLFLFVSISSLIPTSLATSLLAIDYGTDSFKASLVKPGVPFDVLLTKEGKRKISSISSIRGKDRFVGPDASNFLTRFPGDTVSSVKLLLGHGSNHPQSKLHERLFGIPQTTINASPAVKLASSEEGNSLPVVEFLAMELQFAKELAQEQLGGGEIVRESVITVPGWFGESERRSILDAAEIAGLRIVGLINDGTAVGVNYAMTRTFPPQESYHLIYDLGSGSLKVSLVSFKSEMLADPLSLSESPSLRNTTIVQVHGFGWDVEIGGYVFDEIVREILIKGFESTNVGVEVRKDKRAMAKLTKESIRVKQVLSANSQAQARIEGLINDIDFKFLVTREEFQNQIEKLNLLPRLIKPIEQALTTSNLSLKDIESLILVGGSSRVPLVQESISKFLESSPNTLIAKNVNADEAAVLGAGLYGAGIVRGFRTKDIRIKDLYPFGINFTTTTTTGSDGDGESESELLFPPNSNLGTKKTISFKNQTKDFNLKFNYYHHDHDHDQGGLLLSNLNVNGISSTTFSNLTSSSSLTEIENSTVKVVVELDESGLLKIGKATLIIPGDDEQEDGDGEDSDDETGNSNIGGGGMTDKLKGLFNKFGSKKSTSSQEGEEEGNNNSTTSLTEEEKKELEEYLLRRPTKTKLKVETVEMMMSNQDKSEIKKRLRDAKTHLQKKLAREEARNSLESFVYKVRDYLQHRQSFLESSIESERKSIRELNDKLSDWLSDEGEFAKTVELKEKKRELEKLVNHVLNRSIESSTRPNLIDKLEQLLTSSTLFHSSALSNQTNTSESTPSRFTSEELTNFEKLFKETQNWLRDLIKKQSKLKLFQDPILKISDLEKKIKQLEGEFKKLENKKVPRAAKKVTGKKQETTNKEQEKEKEKDKEDTKKSEHKKDEL